MKCYECKEVDMIGEYLPFCSKDCHKKWSEENYKDKPKSKFEQFIKKNENINKD